MNIDLSQYIDLDSFGIYPTVMVSKKMGGYIVLMEWDGHEKSRYIDNTIYDDVALLQDALIAMFYDLHSEVGR